MKYKWLYWTPRILGLICIAGLLFEAFINYTGKDWPLLLGALGSFIWNGGLILFIAVMIAWRWELFGGIILIILGIAYCVIMWFVYPIFESLMILLPAFATILLGILFILSHYFNKK